MTEVRMVKNFLVVVAIEQARGPNVVTIRNTKCYKKYKAVVLISSMRKQLLTKRNI